MQIWLFVISDIFFFLLNIMGYWLDLRVKLLNENKLILIVNDNAFGFYSFIAPIMFTHDILYECSANPGTDHHIQGAYDKFLDFFHMGTFIDSTHMKL